MLDKVYKPLYTFAVEAGLEFRPTTTTMERIQALADKHDMLLCPCQFVPDVLVDREGLIPCPCPSVLEQCEVRGKCHCGTFFKQ